MRKRKSNLSQSDWDIAAGLSCADCGQEAMRIIEGLCPQCHNQMIMERDQKIEEKIARRYYQAKLREGTISLQQMREGR